jgi:hypothetical protein
LMGVARRADQSNTRSRYASFVAFGVGRMVTGRGALECGSLLPLLRRPACWPCTDAAYLGRQGCERARRNKAAARPGRRRSRTNPLQESPKKALTSYAQYASLAKMPGCSAMTVETSRPSPSPLPPSRQNVILCLCYDDRRNFKK